MGVWEGYSYENLCADYKSIAEKRGAVFPGEANVIYACYEQGDYEGWAMVVFCVNETLYENNDAHCSCNGLESWEPEPTLIGALMMRKGQETMKAAVREWVMGLLEPHVVLELEDATLPLRAIKVGRRN
jgi:hypothetical protein